MGLARKERNHLAHQCGSPKLARLKLDVFKQKFRYANFLEALWAARRTERIWPDYRWTIYQCETCGFNHVGRIRLNDVLYMEGDVIPALPAATINNPPNKKSDHTRRSALSKREKERIMAAAGLLATKPKPWEPALEQSTRYRGYHPFKNLQQILERPE